MYVKKSANLAIPPVVTLTTRLPRTENPQDCFGDSLWMASSIIIAALARSNRQLPIDAILSL